MNLNPGREPRALTLSISINPKKPTKRGCYLALTFGTLLSSQGADAPQPRPRGLHRGRLLSVAPRGEPAHGAIPAATLRRSRAAQRQSYVRPPAVSNRIGGDAEHP